MLRSWVLLCLLGGLWTTTQTVHGATATHRNNRPHTTKQTVHGQHSFQRAPYTTTTTTNTLLGMRGGGGRRRPQHQKTSPPQPAIPPGSATASAEIFNLIKSIVGAGVLGLPAGIAAFGGNAPSALVPSLVLLVAIGGLAAHGFYQIGVVSHVTQSTSYQQSWSRSVSDRTAWMPATACLLVTACTVLTYSMILADTVPAVVESLVGLVVGRTPALLGLTSIVLLPLCLLRQLSSLAPFSLLGILGMVYTASAMMVRWLTGAYGTTSGDSHTSVLVQALAQQFRPKFGTAGWKSIFCKDSTILVSMLSTAFMAHYNAPKFFWELEDRTQFAPVVWTSFAGAVGLMAVIAIAGFGTFGGASNALILNNYSPTDSLMSFSRAAVTTSLIFSYPLAFVGVRDNVLNLADVPDHQRTPRLMDALTVFLLAVITGLAFVVTDIRAILSVGGATWGNLLVYVFPALMMVQAAKSHDELKRQVPLSVCTGVLGLGLGMVGTVRAIQSL